MTTGKKPAFQFGLSIILGVLTIIAISSASYIGLMNF
jgi:hypothetical protein